MKTLLLSGQDGTRPGNAYTVIMRRSLTLSTSGDRKYHRGELRTALVDAALGLLAEDGVDAVSLRAVARRVGVSAMAPYRHYPDKEALLAAVAAQGFERLRAALYAADAAAPAGQALVEQAVAYVGYALGNPALFRLMFGAKRTGIHPEMAASGNAAYAVLATRVAAEISSDADQDACVLGCWSMVHGLALLFLDGRIGQKTAVSPDAVTRSVASVMLHYQ